MKRTIIIDDPPQPLGRPGGAGHWVRVAISFGCALAADGLQWLIPPLWVFCDGAMVVALLMIWGWRWEIAVVVVPEVIPGFDLFPTWTLFIGYLAMVRRKESGTPRPIERPMKRVEPL